jgi:hypothetical protein
MYNLGEVNFIQVIPGKVNHKNNKRHTVPAYFVVDFPRNNYRG